MGNVTFSAEIEAGRFRALGAVLEFAGSTKPYFAVRLRFGGGRVEAVATDGFKAGIISTPAMSEEEFEVNILKDDWREITRLVSAADARKWSAIPVNLVFDSAAKHFRANYADKSVVCGVDDVRLPDIERIFPEPEDYRPISTIRFEPKYVLKVMRAAQLVAGKRGYVNAYFVSETRPFVFEAADEHLDVCLRAVVMPLRTRRKPVKVEPKEAKAVKVEPEPVKVKPVESEAVKVEAEPVSSEPVAVEPEPKEAMKVEPVEPVKVEPKEAKAVKAEPETVEPVKWTSKRVGKIVAGAGLTVKMIDRAVKALNEGKPVPETVAWATGSSRGRRFDKAVAALTGAAV